MLLSGMPGEVEHMHHAFPYRLTFECLADRNGLGERRGAAVHVLDGLFEVTWILRHLAETLGAKFLQPRRPFSVDELGCPLPTTRRDARPPS